MRLIPVKPVPNQTLTVSLAGQPTRLNLIQRPTGLYIDVLVNSVRIISSVACMDRRRIVRDAYLGFTGDLAFFDTQGVSDPYYAQLGSRWVLLYLETADL